MQNDRLRTHLLINLKMQIIRLGILSFNFMHDFPPIGSVTIYCILLKNCLFVCLSCLLPTSRWQNPLILDNMGHGGPLYQKVQKFRSFKLNIFLMFFWKNVCLPELSLANFSLTKSFNFGQRGLWWSTLPPVVITVYLEVKEF